MRSLLVGILMIIANPLPLWGQPAPAPSKFSPTLSLVFSSNLQGEVEPCG